MTRTTAWLSVVSCAALLAAVSMGGCGSSTPASNGKGGNGGNHDGAAGAGGSAPGAGGDNGAAGSAAGAGGDNGTAGAAGGAAGAAGGAAGATAGAGGGSAGATDGGSDATGDTKADGGDAASDMSSTESGSDAAAPICGDGNLCTENGTTCETDCVRGRQSFCLCFDPAGGPARLEYQCFMNVVCTNPDAGTDGGSDAGNSTDAGNTDAGNDGGSIISTCPAGIATGDACSADAGIQLCETTCTNNVQRTCTCGRAGWRCSTQPHRCL